MVPRNDTDTSAIHLHEDAIASLQAGRLAEAIATCQQALQLRPDLAEACKTLGVAYQRRGDFQEALIWHLKALEIKPDFAEVYGNLGSWYAEQKMWSDALTTYQMALQFNPDLAGVYRNLAQLLILFKQYPEAISYCQEAIARQPEAGKAHYLLGNALAGLGRWAEAETAYQHCIKLSPNSDFIYLDWGNMLAQQGKWDGAIAAYKRAIQLNPNNELAHHKLGNAWFRLQELEKAIAAYQKAIKINPDTPWSHQPLGRALIEVGNLKEALEVCSRAVDLNPDSYWSHENLADALSGTGQFAEAVPIYLQALWQIPENRPGVNNSLSRKLGHAMREHSQGDAAIASLWLSKMIWYQPDENWQNLGLNTGDPELYLQWGELLAKNHQFEGAIAFHDLAREIRPDDPEILKKWENVCRQHREFEEKIAALQTAIAKAPDRPQPHTELGNFLCDQNRFDEAADCHKIALKLRGWQESETRGYRFTRDWFGSNITAWEKHLKSRVGIPNFKALEVGSFQGMSTCWLLDRVLTHPTSKITCIDPYFQPEFSDNIAKTGASDRVIKIVGYSQNVLGSLPPRHYDLIYIDGCHLATVAFRDALLSWRLLKVGGMAIFDDYNVAEKGDREQEAKRGIDAFLEQVRDGVDIINEGYQLFFVKTGDGLPDGDMERLLSEVDGSEQDYS
ncbi:MAG: tetratricopeptide repeat protein [Limnospira sp.]